MLLRLPFHPKRCVVVGRSLESEALGERRLVVGCRSSMVVEGEELRNLVVGMARRIGLVGELHTALEAGRHIQVEEKEHHRAVVEELHMVAGEGRHMAADNRLAVVGIDLVGVHHKAAVKDSLAGEEDIGLEEGHRKAVVEERRTVVGKGRHKAAGHSLVAGIL